MARLAATTVTLALQLGAAMALSSDLSAVASAKVEALAKEEQAIRNVPRISIDELKALMAKNAVLVIDVRTAEEYAKGHIPGAVNINYTEVFQQAEKFKGETRTLVAYCACAREMTSARAAVDLAQKGITGAKALVGGWDEWLQRGEKIER